MKLISWTIIILSILLVAALFFSIDLWAGEWKDLFFYLEDWRMWVIIFVFVYLVKEIIQRLLIAEVKVLK